MCSERVWRGEPEVPACLRWPGHTQVDAGVFLVHSYPDIIPIFATSEPSTGLLAVVHQCSTRFCDLVDFVPLKCGRCGRKFCGEHSNPPEASHKCDKYDEHSYNRMAPSCGFSLCRSLCQLCRFPWDRPVAQHAWDIIPGTSFLLDRIQESEWNRTSQMNPWS